MMKRIAAALVLSFLVACGSPAPTETASEPAPPPPPRDESHRFPKEGLVETSIDAEHALGKEFLPPGNVGQYERDGKSYSLFLVSAADPQAAGLLEYDISDHLTDAKFIAAYGGHFGMEGGQPWFIFGKNSAVAGIVGLPEDEAEPIAREFAARME